MLYGSNRHVAAYSSICAALTNASETGGNMVSSSPAQHAYNADRQAKTTDTTSQCEDYPSCGWSLNHKGSLKSSSGVARSDGQEDADSACSTVLITYPL